jgi:hypothetical protein
MRGFDAVYEQVKAGTQLPPAARPAEIDHTHRQAHQPSQAYHQPADPNKTMFSASRRPGSEGFFDNPTSAYSK